MTSQTMQGIVLFGVKSPIVVDYEESLARAGIALIAGVSVDGASRMLERKKLVALADCAERFAGAAFLPVAFAARNRQDLCDLAHERGLQPGAALVDPTAAVARSCKIGRGSYLNAGVIVGGASLLGRCVIVNRASSVGHHALIDDFASIGPGVTIASNVRIGAGATLGAGAVVLPDVRIGDGAVVAAGAVVRRDVAPGTLVSGNPARPSRLRPDRTRVWRNEQE